ncbi:AraC family transcriptional regulator [Massilia niastensis]|uniref:AraC family transcriptional regulator n=1 Tax=Massilia niastensis TaxID=544911 RepID=UPI000366F703|nr:AraC family transcriptional regulator [Massilia niastensis]
MNRSTNEAAGANTIEVLAREISRVTRTNGDHVTTVPGLTLHRRSVAASPMPCIYGFGLGVIAQGSKQVMLGEKVYEYTPGDAMLTTVDLPVVSNVTVASTEAPFLGLMLSIDRRIVLQLAADMNLDQAPKECAYQSIAFKALDPAVLACLIRLVRLTDEALLAPFVAPLVQREIVVRLLTGAFGPLLRHVVATGSPSQQISKAVNWLKQHFSHALRVDELAASVHMSPSTFRLHFRNVTGMSPLQYQKQLRLQEARQLMLSQDMDAGSAGVRVGYDSASQFSREYARLFGAPPLRDIQRMRLEHEVSSATGWKI